MNTKRTRVFVSLLLLTFLAGALTFGEAGAAQRSRKAAVVTPLTDAEKSTMIFLREEEKLARDVYIKMFEFWGAAIFSNISVSEQRHMDAVLQLLVKYGILDPAAGNPVGFFTNQDLQKLYAGLIAQGQLSLLDAYKIGKAIEEMDIADLQKAIDDTDRPDLENVYSSLLSGSYNHLSAFDFHIAGL
jgi:hypothetical protein